ncbi:hypothetical protein B0H14DRAFT_3878336 [Mycena olivaceomarginata]|nr:hypothetical protein B0H14DRAFT_3878336 [Mycena olivaceomarginata]
MSVWIAPAIRSLLGLMERDPTKQTPMVASCVPNGFLTLRRIPVGLDLVLNLRYFNPRLLGRIPPLHCPPRRARRGTIPRVARVPVWMLAHIADTERDESEEGENAVGLV